MDITIIRKAKKAMEQMKTTEMQLESVCGISSVRYDHAGGRSNQIKDSTCDIALRKEMLEERLVQERETSARLYHAAMCELDTVADPVTRQIVFYREWEEMHWAAVARKLGEQYSESTVRQRYCRALRADPIKVS